MQAFSFIICDLDDVYWILSEGPLSEMIVVDLVDNSITVFTVGGEICVESETSNQNSHSYTLCEKNISELELLYFYGDPLEPPQILQPMNQWQTNLNHPTDSQLIFVCLIFQRKSDLWVQQIYSRGVSHVSEGGGHVRLIRFVYLMNTYLNNSNYDWIMPFHIGQNKTHCWGESQNGSAVCRWGVIEYDPSYSSILIQWAKFDFVGRWMSSERK